MRAVGITLLVNWLYLAKKAVLLDLFMVKEVLEQQLVVPFQELLEAEALARILLLVEVVDVEVFVEQCLALEMGWEELILFFEEVHSLIVKWFVVFTVLVEFGHEEIEYFIRVVVFVVFNNLLLGLIGKSMSCKPVSLEPNRSHEIF